MTSKQPAPNGRPSQPDSIRPITEKQLARLWQRRAGRSRALRDENGRKVRVLYPGRPGVTAGPDFRDALMLVEGEALVQGDVEVHLRQRDWRAHGHHNDPNYNGVVLHVALNPGGEPSRTDGGTTPPVVNLHPLLTETEPDADHRAESRRALWAILDRRGYRRPATAEQMSALLNRSGDERFLRRSRRFQAMIASQLPEQTLWESICEALGYRHNQHPFLMLATSAPIHILRASLGQLPDDQRDAAAVAWLLRLAGFDDEPLAEGPPFPPGLGPAIDPRQWRLFRVRPSNHPQQRIRGAASLLAR